MVDSINNDASRNAVLRTQQSVVNGALGIRRLVIEQPQKSAIVPVQASAVHQPEKAAPAAARSLPRGSLVDILA